jgi:hypothetical protein
MAVCSWQRRGKLLWNAQTGQPLTPPLEETNAVAAMEFIQTGAAGDSTEQTIR